MVTEDTGKSNDIYGSLHYCFLKCWNSVKYTGTSSLNQKQIKHIHISYEANSKETFKSIRCKQIKCCKFYLQVPAVCTVLKNSKSYIVKC